MGVKGKVRSVRDFWNYVNRKDYLEVLIFYVTSLCNSRCPGCFFLENLNRPEDLSLDEIKRFAPGLGEVTNILFSGGEPFLRNELQEIIEVFVRENHPDVISIPTNGLLTERIVSVMEWACATYPDTSFNVNPSLDGTGDIHDRIRGVPGGFEQTLTTLDRMGELKQKHHNLMISVNTAIFDQPLENLEALFNLVRKRGADAHFTEVDRSLLQSEPSSEKRDYIRKVHRLCIENGKFYLDRISKRYNLGLFRRIWYYKTAYMYEVQDRVLAGEKLPFPCLAGRNLAVIDPDGAVRLCEPLPPVASLRDVDYDFKKIWHSEAFQEGRKKIVEERCTCTHCVFLDYSIIHNPKAVFFDLPRQYLKYKKNPGENG